MISTHLFDSYEAIKAGKFEKTGKRISFVVKKIEDLQTTFCKTDTCSLKIKELNFESSEGNSRYSSFYDYLKEVEDNIKSCPIADPKSLEFLENIFDEDCFTPFTVVLEDKLGNSFIEIKDKERVKIEEFERLREDDIEFGIETLKQPKKEKEGVIEAAELIKKSKKILFFTGAGSSADSKIPTFRGKKDSIWENYDVEKLVLENILKDEKVRQLHWKMKSDFYKIVKTAKINGNHKLSKYIQDHNQLLGIITQNIDGMHQKSGIEEERVVEIHGNIRTASCYMCKHKLSEEETIKIYESNKFDGISNCPKCKTGIIKTDTIAFGQNLEKKKIKKAEELLFDCDLLILVGCGLLVSPACKFPMIAFNRNVPIIFFNKGTTSFDRFTDVLLDGSSSGFALEVLKELQN